MTLAAPSRVGTMWRKRRRTVLLTLGGIARGALHPGAVLLAAC